jgi:hypothetical protein
LTYSYFKIKLSYSFISKRIKKSSSHLTICPTDRHHYSDSAKEKKWNEEQGVFKNTPCEEEIFLHIAPCGDYWLGQEIYAAKHLPRLGLGLA